MSIDEQTIMTHGFSAAEAEQEGSRRIMTPEGICVYLTLIAADAAPASNAAAGHACAAYGEDNAIASADWDPIRDRYAYVCLLGEWFRARTLRDPGSYRRRWFRAEIPILKAAPNPWESRHRVNEIVRSQMDVIQPAGSADAELGQFLLACFGWMGHVMTGSASGGYYARLAAALEKCDAVRDPHLHAVLRKESVLLRDMLVRPGVRSRDVPLHRVLRDAEAAAREGR